MEDATETSDINEDIESVESQTSGIRLSEEYEIEENEEESSEEENEEDYDEECEEDLIYVKPTPEHEFLRADVKEAAKTWSRLEQDLGISSVQIEPSILGREDTCAVVMTLNISNLSDMIRHLWQLGSGMTVSVIVDGIHKWEYRAFGTLPTVAARIDFDKPSKFPVGECLSNVVKSVIPQTYLLEENQSPSEIGSFFSLVYELLMDRLSTLTEYCMVCGDKLYAGGLLPSICDGELCQFQYQELGLLEGLSTPRVSASVLSLLIMAFNAAVNSHRCEDILTPAPSARDSERLIADTKELYTTIYRECYILGTGDYETHKALASAMPCAHEILQTPAHYGKFKKSLPSIAEFLEWLVISNKSYLDFVPPSLNVDFLHTQEQFLFVADTPAKQAEFDALVKTNGGKTRYLFHGSKNENWHSIIRSGLKNMSGTKYQLVGAVHGAGIYLSNQLKTSFGYCTPFDKRHISEYCLNKKCCFPSMYNHGGINLLAVVEVVDTPEAFRHDKKHIVVVTEEKWCSIRMLVAYGDSFVPEVDLNMLKDHDRQKIQNVVHMFKTASIAERAEHAPKKSESSPSSIDTEPVSPPYKL